MNLKILGITTITLLLFLGIVLYLTTFNTNTDTRIIELSDNSTLKLTSKESFDNFKITEENAEGKTVYVENSWIHLGPIRNEQELREIGIGYSDIFDEENLGCSIYFDENDSSLLGGLCSLHFSDEDTYNRLKIFSGYSYDDAIPSIFNDKNQLKRENFEPSVVTLYKHCQWDIDITGEINEFAC